MKGGEEYAIMSISQSIYSGGNRRTGRNWLSLRAQGRTTAIKSLRPQQRRAEFFTTSNSSEYTPESHPIQVSGGFDSPL